MVNFKVVPKNTTVSFEYPENGVLVRKGFSSNGGVYSVSESVAGTDTFKYYVAKNIFSLVKDVVKEPEVKQEKVKKTPIFSIRSEEPTTAEAVNVEATSDTLSVEPTKRRGRKKAEQE